MVCITESGRVIDASSFPVKELVDGAWVKAASPLYGEELMNARVLSDDELKKLVKSGS